VAAVKVLGVPIEYTYDMLVEMHESFGFDYWAIKDIEFEEPDETDGSKKPMVRGLTVSYTDYETARAAVEALEGQPVANRAGETMYLEAALVQTNGNSVDDGTSHSYAELDQADLDSSATNRRRRDTSSSTHRSRQDFHWREPSASVMRGGWQNRRSASCSTTRSYNSQGGRRRSGWGGKGNDNGPPVIYPSAYISDVPVEYKEETMVQLHKACSLDPATIMGMKFLPTQDASSETCCCIVRYMDQESCDKAVGAIRGRPVLLRSGACKFFGAKMAKPARWMMDRGMQPVGGGEKQGESQTMHGRSDEFAWCAQDKDCVGKMGTLLYEDISSGLPYCEVCWDNWHFEQGMAPSSPVEETAEG